MEYMVIDENGIDISSSVTVIPKAKNNPHYYRRLADEQINKANKFFDDEILAKRLDLTDDEWKENHSEYRKMMDIAGNYEDMGLACLVGKVTDFLSVGKDRPLLTKAQATEAFRAYFEIQNLPQIANLL